MGYTMAEKILMKNTGLSHLAPGDLIMTRPDMCMPVRRGWIYHKISLLSLTAADPV